MSKVTAYYHIVFCTKSRKMTIPLQYKDDVYRFIWKEIKGLNCELLRIGGIQNHVHMLVNLHPAVPLAVLMQNVKARSSSWMKQDGRFAFFEGWAADYFGSSVSPDHKHYVIEYIKSQEIHHAATDVEGELQGMYRCADLIYDERDMR